MVTVQIVAIVHEHDIAGPDLTEHTLRNFFPIVRRRVVAVN